MLRLTGVPHPDVNEGKSSPIYVDPTRVLVIETSVTRFAKKGSQEAWRQAANSLHEEVIRVAAEASNPPSMVVDSQESEQALNSYVRTREAAASLNAAYGLLTKAGIDCAWHEEIPCTVVSLACGTGLEYGVMLCRVNVMEPPEEVARLVAREIQAALGRMLNPG